MYRQPNLKEFPNSIDSTTNITLNYLTESVGNGIFTMNSDAWEENRSSASMNNSPHIKEPRKTSHSLRWRIGLAGSILVSAAFVPFWAFRYEPQAAPVPESMRSQITDPAARDETKKIAVPPAATVPLSIERRHEVGRGDTIIEIIADAGVSQADAHRMVQHLKKHYRPRDLRPGHEILLSFKPDANSNPGEFTKLTIRPTIDREIILVPDADRGYRVIKQNKPLDIVTKRSAGVIRSSLYEAAVDAGMPPPLLMELVRIFSWDVDFQREIRDGDRFEAMFERVVTEQGAFVRHGRLLFARLILRGDDHPLYLYKTRKGLVDYFDAKGRSARKALMKTPINGARLSSRYGLRRHPVLGYNKMHRGLDFAAPSGTPIFAAGSGTIVYRARKGAYGNYVRIRHNSEFSTAYGHLKSFARKARKGSRVKQGQIIGYVGTTGRSTGPHLHYEVLRRGRQTNPMRIKMPSGRKLAGAELARYQGQRTAYDDWFAALPNSIKQPKQTAAR